MQIKLIHGVCVTNMASTTFYCVQDYFVGVMTRVIPSLKRLKTHCLPLAIVAAKVK